ncbi:MAG: tRNA lysidine(34) synthetase TilS [Desulfobacterales bacterium]
MTPTPNSLADSPIGRRILATVRRTITDYEMAGSGAAVLVGVSGGPDSVALLQILQYLTPEYGWRLAVAHLNHGLRREADDDAGFVAALAAGLKLECHTLKKDVARFGSHRRLSLEEAGRMVRYDFFEEVAARHGFDKIALGHQADDNAELMLMFILRGSGSLGLAGIPPVRAKRIIRPLIRLSRRDILDTLNAAGLAYVTDRSNRDSRFMRNRIRHRLMPLLRDSYNPQVSAALNRLAEIQRQEHGWIEVVADALYRDARLPAPAGTLRLSIPRLARHPVAAQRRILRKAIGEIKGDLRRISFAHLKSATDLLSLNRRDGRIVLPEGLVLVRSADSLRMSMGDVPVRGKSIAGADILPVTCCHVVDKPAGQEPVIVAMADTGCRVIFSTVTAGAAADYRQAGQRVAFFDMNRLSFPLTLRRIRAGDRFRPFGLRGSQKISKYLIDHKVPREKRPTCLVLLSQGRIIWLVGHRTGDEGGMTPATRDIMRAEITCLPGDRD